MGCQVCPNKAQYLLVLIFHVHRPIDIPDRVTCQCFNLELSQVLFDRGRIIFIYSLSVQMPSQISTGHQIECQQPTHQTPEASSLCEHHSPHLSGARIQALGISGAILCPPKLVCNPSPTRSIHIPPKKFNCLITFFGTRNLAMRGHKPTITEK